MRRARFELRPKDIYRGLTAVGVCLLVVVAEITSHTLRDFFVDHPLEAGLVSGLLLAGVAYGVIDAWAAVLRRRRWTPVSSLAFKAVAADVTLVIDVFAWLLTAIEPDNDARPKVEHQARLLELLDAAGLTWVSGTDLGAVTYEDCSQRLLSLCVHPQWCYFAMRRLDDAKWRQRRSVADWAAAMVSTGELSEVLIRVAKFNQDVSDVQQWLRAISKQPGYEDTTASPSQVESVWFSAVGEGISLREDLIRSSGAPTKVWWKFRAVLPPHLQHLVEEKERQASDEEKAAQVLITQLLPSIQSP